MQRKHSKKWFYATAIMAVCSFASRMNVKAQSITEEKDYRFTISADQAGERFASYQGMHFYKDEAGNIRSYDDNGVPAVNDFFCDGTYTYYFQLDGTCMKDRLTYHPDGEHVIYFDQYGHEVFDNFANIKMTIAGDAVDDICYFNTFGYLYVDETTFVTAGDGSQIAYYMNGQGLLQKGGWFVYANGKDIGYADPDTGALIYNQWSYNQAGQSVYFRADGKIMRGDTFDGQQILVFDPQDGHYVAALPARFKRYETVMTSRRTKDFVSGEVESKKYDYDPYGNERGDTYPYENIGAWRLRPQNVQYDEFTRVSSFDVYYSDGLSGMEPVYAGSGKYTYGDHTETLLYTSGDTWSRYVATWNDQEYQMIGTNHLGKEVYRHILIYDERGNLIYSYADDESGSFVADVRTHEYQYDSNNNCIEETFSSYIYSTTAYDSYHISREYDAYGNLIKEIKDNREVAYNYDAEQRLISKTSTDLRSGDVYIIEQNTYDDNGLLMRSEVGNYLTEYSYDGAGNLIQKVHIITDRNLMTGQYEYAYDDKGRVMKEVYTDYSSADGSKNFTETTETQYEAEYRIERILKQSFYTVSGIPQVSCAKSDNYYDNDNHLIKWVSYGSDLETITSVGEYTYQTIPVFYNPRAVRISMGQIFK